MLLSGLLCCLMYQVYIVVVLLSSVWPSSGFAEEVYSTPPLFKTDTSLQRTQSHIQSPRALWPAIGRQDRLWGNRNILIGCLVNSLHCLTTEILLLSQSTCISWQPTAGQRAWGVWLWGCRGLLFAKATSLRQVMIDGQVDWLPKCFIPLFLRQTSLRHM